MGESGVVWELMLSCDRRRVDQLWFHHSHRFLLRKLLLFITTDKSRDRGKLSKGGIGVMRDEKLKLEDLQFLTHTRWIGTRTSLSRLTSSDVRPDVSTKERGKGIPKEREVTRIRVSYSKKKGSYIKLHEGV